MNHKKELLRSLWVGSRVYRAVSLPAHPSLCNRARASAKATVTRQGSFRKIRGTLIWGPYNKDPTIKGTILGSPIFGNPHKGYHRANAGYHSGQELEV